MNGIKKLSHSLTANIIGAVVLAVVLFGVIVGALGSVSFANNFRDEYSETTYHMADTATSLVNGDHLGLYLKGEEMTEYNRTKKYLDYYCRNMAVSLVYVIQVDKSDYGRFVSIFNSVDNRVDDTTYTEWELGHQRNTTNDEYRQKYKALYDKKVSHETVYRLNPADGSHPHITTLVPIMSSYGDVTGILCIQRPMSELRGAIYPYLRRIAVTVFLTSVVIVLLVSAFIRRQFVIPVRRVSAEATRFARDNTKGKELGELSRYAELADLARSIDTMETDMVSYMDNLKTITAEKERINAELSLASTIQENSIPNRFPAFPDRKDFDIYASMTPAKEVGGDFYNFFLIDQDHLAMVMGDVSGKGVPAALFMMVTNILVTERTKMGGSPGEILQFVNTTICERNEADMFVTLWLGILELSTGRIIASNAGHEDPAVYKKDGSFTLFKTKHDLVAGAMEGIPYRNYEMQLGKGDKLFIYTDGVPEATDKDNSLFGFERMLDSLNENKEKSPKEILEGIHSSVRAFTGEAAQFDDLTILCLEYK